MPWQGQPLTKFGWPGISIALCQPLQPAPPGPRNKRVSPQDAGALWRRSIKVPGNGPNRPRGTSNQDHSLQNVLDPPHSATWHSGTGSAGITGNNYQLELAKHAGKAWWLFSPLAHAIHIRLRKNDRTELLPRSSQIRDGCVKLSGKLLGNKSFFQAMAGIEQDLVANVRVGADLYPINIRH